MATSTLHQGRHFLQIPGPTNVPDRVLQAMNRPTIDHRGPEFATLTHSILDRLQKVFQTKGPVVIYPASGSGAWEAALVNTLSPGDRVLMCETGHFAHLWSEIAERLKLEVEWIEGDWRHGVNCEEVARRLANDHDHQLKAVAVVHNETSTGVVSDILGVRKAIDGGRHPALLMVDTISSLGSMDYRHDEWGVDITVGGSQKGLMVPPGLGFNAVSEKALEVSETAKLASAYWDWEKVITANKSGFFPYTPATNLLYGLDEALDILLEEGLDAVFSRAGPDAPGQGQDHEPYGAQAPDRLPGGAPHVDQRGGARRDERPDLGERGLRFSERRAHQRRAGQGLRGKAGNRCS